TIGTGAPGKGGINSQGVMTLLREKSPEAEGEEQAEAEPAAAEGDGAEGAEGAEGEGAAVQPPAQEEEVVDEDELMFIWNKREAPHYRRGKVDAALEERLQETIEIEETLKKRLGGRPLASARTIRRAPWPMANGHSFFQSPSRSPRQEPWRVSFRRRAGRLSSIPRPCSRMSGRRS
ncbi:MAG: hypothetical protein ACPIOQ_76255, partial [Promethearchaeia archaeon]